MSDKMLSRARVSEVVHKQDAPAVEIKYDST